MSEIFVSSEHENFANAAARTAAAGALSEVRKTELSARGGRWREISNVAGPAAAAGSLSERRKRELSDCGGRWQGVANEAGQKARGGRLHTISNAARLKATAGTSSRAGRAHIAPVQLVKIQAQR